MSGENFWAITPNVGLGPLKFGMSPAEVNVYSEVYGAISGRGSDRATDSLLYDTIEKFGGAMSDEEKQAFIAIYQQDGPSAQSVTETRGNPGIVLRYEANQLVEIMPAIGQRPVFLGGIDLFSISAREALSLLERHNGSPGRYADTEAAFDTLAISTEGFCVTNKASGVRVLGDDNETFEGRTIMLRETAYIVEKEADRFIIHSVLG